MNIKDKANILQKALQAMGVKYICPAYAGLDYDDHYNSDSNFYLMDLLDKTNTSCGTFTKSGYPVLMKLKTEFANDCRPSQRLNLETCCKLVESIDAGVIIDHITGDDIWLKDRPCILPLDDFSWEKLAIRIDLN